MAQGEAMPFSPLRGEKALMVTRPHLLSMLGLGLFWVFIGAVGVAHLHYYPRLMALVQGKVQADLSPLAWLPHFDFVVRHAYDLVWVLSLLIPLVIMAIFRINFGYVLTLLGLIAANLLIQWKLEPRLNLPLGHHANLENYLLIAVGLCGVVGCEVYRRGHRYFLTTHRIVARFGAVKVSERITLYSKIDDLILQQGLLGKFFNFGTVIPITSSGLGMGQDLAIAGAQMGGGAGGRAGVAAGLFAAGGKAQNVPRELSIYVLYKIKDPQKARDLILEEMHARERPRRM